MFLTVFLLIELVALICLVLSIQKDVTGNRSYLLSFLAVMMFVFLSISSFNIQTEKCENVLVSESVSGNVTTLTNSYSCNINVYQDRILSYFNIGLAFTSLLYGISLILIKRE